MIGKKMIVVYYITCWQNKPIDKFLLKICYNNCLLKMLYPSFMGSETTKDLCWQKQKKIHLFKPITFLSIKSMTTESKYHYNINLYYNKTGIIIKQCVLILSAYFFSRNIIVKKENNLFFLLKIQITLLLLLRKYSHHKNDPLINFCIW